MKKQIEKIRAAKTWQERVEIAKDKWPGTPFDWLFKQVETAQQLKTAYPPITRQCYERLGVWVADVIIRRDPQALHDAAKALATLKRRKPKRDYALEALFWLTGLYYLGWEKNQLVGFHPKSGKPIIGLKTKKRVKIATRDVLTRMQELDPNFDPEKIGNYSRKIQRAAKEFHIALDDTKTNWVRQDSAIKF